MAKHKHQSSHDGRATIGRKIAHLQREEGKTPKQAAGQAFGMARQGSLGSAAKSAAGKEPHKSGHKFANPNATHLWPETNLRGAHPRKY